MFVGNAQSRAELARLAGVFLPATALLGPKGVGKLSSALWYVQKMLCAHTGSECETCDRIANEMHPDVKILKLDGLSIGIDPVRDALDWVYEFPLEASNRVLVIEEASSLTPPAANTLLKAVEEPPARSRFVFTASGDMLPTLLNRCTTVEFCRVSDAELLEVLGDTDKARTAASYADGSFSVAKALMDSDLLERIQQFADFIRSKGSTAQVLGLLKADDELEAWFRVFVRTFYDYALKNGMDDDRAELWRLVTAARTGIAGITTTAPYHVKNALLEWASV